MRQNRLRSFQSKFMAKILITSGPTREYLDPIRFISNQSSGRMGVALAEAALDFGHEVCVVSGPVHVSYPTNAEVVSVETTTEMHDAVGNHFPMCDGIIAAAAPCDFRPKTFVDSKIKKSGDGMIIEFTETSDILSSVSHDKHAAQWAVGFALETDNGIENAMKKLIEKKLNLIVLNGPEAMNSETNRIRILGINGIIAGFEGTKHNIARNIINTIFDSLKNSTTAF